MNGIRPLIAACALVLAGWSRATVAWFAIAEPIDFGNDHVSAIFNDRGLAALSDKQSGSRITFKRDDFAIVIDGITYDSQSLAAPAHKVDSAGRIYSWTAGPHRLDVVYELQPDWRFLSKQLVVRSRAQSVHVNQLAVFRTELGDRIEGLYVPKSVNPALGTGDYGSFVRLGAHGLLALVQNPFLAFVRNGQSFSITYTPDLNWRSADGPFVSDRGLLAPYTLTNRRVPARMIEEWKLGSHDEGGADEAEIDAFTDTVRAFLSYRPTRPLNIFVGWCVNDYQIDVGTPEGRTGYKRLIDRAAEVGAEYVLYAPSNSMVSRREESIDDWSWEHVLWLGLGQKIRKGEWDPIRDPVPESVQQMLDHARAKHVKLLAYVYPVLPFAGNPAWLVRVRDKPGRMRASLGVRGWQDHLIETLVAFYQRTGIGGYAFDHTFLDYEGTSRYAQWSGWRRVMEELRRRIPDIAIDGRQAYHLYGPWSWLAGSYPHPTFNDEQPESFTPFPDLHFDRVSANRERYTAYRYRNYEFAPSEIVPGFITHQTPRLDDTNDMPHTRNTDRGVVLTQFRERDWDYLGWRYSLLSSIAVASWNNVLNMIPARDLDEHRHFADADKRWFRGWIDWTREHAEVLRHTRTILGHPAIGRIDGTSAIVGDRGYLFLFNPNARRLTTQLTLDGAIGLTRPGHFLLRELHPLSGRLIGKPDLGVWTAGDHVSIEMDGQSALVLELLRATDMTEPIVFGVPGIASVSNDGVLRLTNVRGEMGATTDILVLLPGPRRVSALRINDQPVNMSQADRMIRASVRFDGAPFRRAQQIDEWNPAFSGGHVSATLTIPARVFDQLAVRARAWPIPWRPEDLRNTWLAPERLLLYVQIAEPDDSWNVRLTIDDHPVDLQKAYTALHPEKRTFVGFYADVSHLASDRPYRLELDLPPLKAGQFQGVFLENIETEYTEKVVPF
jgi:hypothetical protein